ncbi:hypothetical protein ON010_g9975 [Phytophthora cinnamomi]|nr:hypothetical protein ON010_g9975 [Phytophthora cinnamomi]
MGNVSSCYKTKKQEDSKAPSNDDADDVSSKAYAESIDEPRAAEPTKERASIQGHQPATDASHPTPENSH